MGNKVAIKDAQFISRAGRDIVTETIGREVGGVGKAVGQAIQDNISPLKKRQMANKLTVEDAAFISRAGRDIVTETIGREIGAVGTAIGAAVFAVTNEPVWIAVGVAIGAALGWNKPKTKN